MTQSWPSAIAVVALVSLAVSVAASAQTVPAGAPPPPFGATRGLHAAARIKPGITRCATPADFLAYHNLPCVMTGGMPLPAATPAELERNKELVERFYQGDDSVMADGFAQHDPAEPSTRKDWEHFFAYRGMFHGKPGEPTPPHAGGKSGYGDTPTDASGAPVNYLIAEGDIVVALRFRWWPWEYGPEPVYKGVFADVWRIKSGKLAEQWCSCTPDDATPMGIAQAKKDGAWFKYTTMNEQ